MVKPVLPILDMLYSTRLVLEGLAGKYGRIPQLWPPSVVAQLRQRNTLLEQRIQRVICSLSNASYFTLGACYDLTSNINEGSATLAACLKLLHRWALCLP